jgi:hypothetical protein
MDTVSTDWAAASYLAQRLRLLPLAFPVANGFWEGGSLPDGWLTLHPLVIQSCKKQIDTLWYIISGNFYLKIAMENPNLQWENQRKCGDDLKSGYLPLPNWKHTSRYTEKKDVIHGVVLCQSRWLEGLLGGSRLLGVTSCPRSKHVKCSNCSMVLIFLLLVGETMDKSKIIIPYMSLINASGVTSLHF